MKKFLIFALAICGLSANATVVTSPTPWEYIKEIIGGYAVHVTEKGSLLASDYLFDDPNSIWRSTDKGTNWETVNTNTFTTNRFYETDGYIFGLGLGGKVFRSEDDGATWKTLSYASAAPDVFPGGNAGSTAAYGIVKHNGRLYVADYCGAGVVYSEDFGETWKRTDPEAMTIHEKDKESGKEVSYVENLYELISYKGELYVTGLYCVYKYNEKSNSWTLLRSDSNCMATSCEWQGHLCVARAMPNFSSSTPFVMYTDDFKSWKNTTNPTSEYHYDTNIHTLFSYGDWLFVGMQTHGVYATKDGKNWIKLTEGMEDVDPVNFPGEKKGIMKFAADEDYIYCCVYDEPWNMFTVGGIYRIPHSAYTTDVEGIKGVKLDNSPKTVHDLQGRAVPSVNKGVYIIDGKKTLKK